ncbi:hypothetical protein SAMN02910298_02592 [Pseudobutyrivibrio sp. YE44]|nr:hypothetical protein SAMN02910298_02592 [Pseudobutyrivibrio sp. YE44]
MNSVITDIESCFKNYKSQADVVLLKFDNFVNNDSFQGDEADASKEFVNTVEKGFINSQLEMQKKLLEMYRHAVTSFAEKVDSAPNARIDLEHLNEAEAELRSIYRELVSYSDFFESVVDDLNRNHGNVYNFSRPYSKPYSKPAKEALSHLCGGDDLDAGFIHSVKQAFIKYDMEESAYIDSMKLINVARYI